MTEMDKLHAALTEMGIEHTYDRDSSSTRTESGCGMLSAHGFPTAVGLACWK